MKISSTALFSGISPNDVEAMLPCLNARERRFEKGEYILRAGKPTSHFGVVLEGRVRVEVSDAWGNVSILETCEPGMLFAHGYACVSGEPLDIDVVADSNAVVLLLEAERIVRSCPRQCSCHVEIAGNLVRSLARRNLDMNRRAVAIMPKTTRGKILAYLSQEQQKAGTQSFDIPYNQTKLASYLGVDRSTLSAEISKLRKDGVIECKGSRYTLL